MGGSAAGESQKAASSSASSPSPRAVNYTLSGVAFKKLMALYRTVTKHSATALTPLQLARKVLATDALLHRARGGMILEDELELDDAQDELEDAPMESLSPELQALKRGFEELPIDTASAKGIERRINELLLSAGETRKLKVIFSSLRVDISTKPPTRVAKTEGELREEQFKHTEYTNEIRKRNPKLFFIIAKLVSELNRPRPLSRKESVLPSGVNLPGNVSL